jgi:nucleotide-binding universal stress UspA family protein
MNRIEFVGNALFIPFFLIGVGMLIDYKAFIKDGEALYVAGIMTFIASIGKYIPAYLTQKIYGYSTDERRLIFGLSNAQAAATLAAVLVGFNIIVDYKSVTTYNEIHLKNNKLITYSNQVIVFNELEKGAFPQLGSIANVDNIPADGNYQLSDKTKMKFVDGQLADLKLPNRLLNENVLNGTILMILITCTIASFVAQKGAYNLALAESEGENNDDDVVFDANEKILIPLKNIEGLDELMNLAVTIKSKTNKEGLFALNVISNNSSKLGLENRAKKIVDRAAVVASATDTKLNMLVRYDLNILNGVSSVVKEHKITDILLGQTELDNLSDILFGSLTDGILNKCNTTTMIYKSIQPMGTVGRINVVIPENAEREIGFPFWLVKIWNLGKNTNLKILFYGTETTLNFIKDIQVKHPLVAEFKLFTDWDSFQFIADHTTRNDMVVIIMSRKLNLSYNSSMNNVPNYLTRYFEKSNVLIIYPLQMRLAGSKLDLKSSAALEAFTDNFERLDDVRKLIGKLLRLK